MAGLQGPKGELWGVPPLNAWRGSDVAGCVLAGSMSVCRMGLRAAFHQEHTRENCRDVGPS